jgi:hypothetical protein
MAKRRRILRRFSISEVSAVDRPAQAHARVLIMKRHVILEGPGIMDGIVDDTPSADQRLLESVQSILEDDELDAATRNVMLLDTVQQYVVYTGADTATARQGAPLGGLSSPDITITAIHKRAEEDRRKGESVYQARARLWQSPDEILKRTRPIEAETAEQRRNRMKQERAERDGAPAHSTAVKALRAHASSRFPELSVAQAVAKFAASRDPDDRAIWNAAKESAD